MTLSGYKSRRVPKIRNLRIRSRPIKNSKRKKNLSGSRELNSKEKMT
jgi:hypothetical protein